MTVARDRRGRHCTLTRRDLQPAGFTIDIHINSLNWPREPWFGISRSDEAEDDQRGLA